VLHCCAARSVALHVTDYCWKQQYAICKYAPHGLLAGRELNDYTAHGGQLPTTICHRLQAFVFSLKSAHRCQSARWVVYLSLACYQVSTTIHIHIRMCSWHAASARLTQDNIAAQIYMPTIFVDTTTTTVQLYNTASCTTTPTFILDGSRNFQSYDQMRQLWTSLPALLHCSGMIVSRIW